MYVDNGLTPKIFILFFEEDELEYGFSKDEIEEEDMTIKGYAGFPQELDALFNYLKQEIETKANTVKS